MARRIKQPDFELIESDVVPVGDVITISGLRADFPRNFVGVQFFADAAGLIPATPGAGTVVVTIETINTEGVFEAITGDTITATAVTTINWDANSSKVKLTPAGITVATHYKAVWTGNRN